MTNTAAGQTFTAEARTMIDDLEGRLGKFNATANVRPNAFGGFDVRQPLGGTIRTAKDDVDWIVYLYDPYMCLMGSQRLSGCFADLDSVSYAVAVLL